mmetsp:Transcript_43592/g.85375  ORF Transcript_43592/g.85375 Transcript_43592/m.85375 type:complete len:284 (+) Transcript_43592:260-1111(+)
MQDLLVVLLTLLQELHIHARFCVVHFPVQARHTEKGRQIHFLVVFFDLLRLGFLRRVEGVQPNLKEVDALQGQLVDLGLACQLQLVVLTLPVEQDFGFHHVRVAIGHLIADLLVELQVHLRVEFFEQLLQTVNTAFVHLTLPGEVRFESYDVLVQARRVLQQLDVVCDVTVQDVELEGFVDPRQPLFEDIPGLLEASGQRTGRRFLQLQLLELQDSCASPFTSLLLRLFACSALLLLPVAGLRQLQPVEVERPPRPGHVCPHHLVLIQTGGFGVVLQRKSALR